MCLIIIDYEMCGKLVYYIIIVVGIKMDFLI